MVEVWSCLALPPQNNGAIIFFGKLNGKHHLIANIFKLHEHYTFVLMIMHKMSKIWFANNKFSLLKSLVYINMPSKMLFWNFCIFYFSKFQMTIVKNLMEKPSVFIMDFEDSYEVLLIKSQIVLIYTFLQWNDGPFEIFL